MCLAVVVVVVAAAVVVVVVVVVVAVAAVAVVVPACAGVVLFQLLWRSYCTVILVVGCGGRDGTRCATTDSPDFFCLFCLARQLLNDAATEAEAETRAPTPRAVVGQLLKTDKPHGIITRVESLGADSPDLHSPSRKTFVDMDDLDELEDVDEMAEAVNDPEDSPRKQR